MRWMLAAAAIGLLLGTPRPAAAQPKAWPERIWFSVSGGVQPAVNSFGDHFDVPLYTETERVTIDYPVKGGAIIAASGGYRVWKQLAVGIGVTRYNRSADASVTASVPHPFFDNQLRQTEGKVPATRSEVGAHVLVGWMLPLTPRLRLLLTAGPSVLSVGQTLVTGVEVMEVYPYDTASFKSATTTDSSGTATGFNAGADLFWMFSRSVGAGGLVQFTRATAKQRAGDRTISVDAGGAQIGAGLRLVF